MEFGNVQINWSRMMGSWPKLSGKWRKLNLNPKKSTSENCSKKIFNDGNMERIIKMISNKIFMTKNQRIKVKSQTLT